MPSDKHSFRSSLIVKLVVGIGLSFTMAALAARYYVSPTERQVALPLEGFNYRILLSETSNDKPTWRGPRIGERIDLAKFKDRNGNTLADLMNKRPVMLALVNPSCQMCKVGATKCGAYVIASLMSALSITYSPSLHLPQLATSSILLIR